LHCSFAVRGNILAGVDVVVDFEVIFEAAGGEDGVGENEVENDEVCCVGGCW